MSEKRKMHTVGIHLGEYAEPKEMERQLEMGAEPFIVVRPCSDLNADIVFDVTLSLTSKTAAVMFLEASAKVLRGMIETEDPGTEIPYPVDLEKYAQEQVELLIEDLEQGSGA